MDLGLAGKIALVTGGARGIGAGISTVLAQEGANLVVNYRSAPEECEAFAKRLADTYGVKTVAVQADVSRESEIERLFQTAVDAFGGVDLLVNNAGTWGNTLVQDIETEEWNRLVETNLTGMFILCRTFARHCLAQKKGGRCVNVLSKAAVSTNSVGNVHYMATKGGGLMLTKGFANELTQYGIYFNAILPGYVISHGAAYDKVTPETERKKKLLKTGQFATAEEMGYVTAFLLSDKASQVAGEIMDCTGGLLL